MLPCFLQCVCWCLFCNSLRSSHICLCVLLGSMMSSINPKVIIQLNITTLQFRYMYIYPCVYMFMCVCIRAEQLINLINNCDYWEIINVMTIIVMSIIHMVYKKSHQNLHRLCKSFWSKICYPYCHKPKYIDVWYS